MPSLSVSVLRIKDFRLLLCTRMLGSMALQAQALIVGWQVYSITHDPFMLGLTGLTEALPAISCAFFSGYIVDISRPHRIFLLCIGALALNCLTLWVTAGGMLDMHTSTLLPWIFGGIFISGVARSFIAPSSFSILPHVVPRAEIPAAGAWMTSGFQVAMITGPMAAGLIYGGYGVEAAWLIPVSLMSIALLMLMGMSPATRQLRSEDIREPVAESIKAGWKFIIKNRVLLSVMALDMFAVLFGGAVALLPAFSDQVLHTGAEGLGALRAAPAVGAIITALVLALWPMEKIRGITLLWAVVGFGVCMIGFGLSQVFWVAMVFLALSGAFDSVSMVIRSTLMQLLTPNNMRGRVSSVESMFIISSNEIGAFESGTAARLMGLVPSILFGGIGTLVVVAVTAKLAPQLRKMAVSADDAAKN